MPATIPVARQHLIDDIARQARRRRRPAPPLPLAEFVQAYYRGVGEDDLAFREPAAFAAAAAAHLAFGRVRRAGQPLVRVFNPDDAEHGWHSPCTIVEVVTDDMPFLVDSLAMVLNDAGLSVQLMVHPVLRVSRDGRGRLLRLEPADGERGLAESWQHLAVPRIRAAAELEQIRARILRTLEDVRLAVGDWAAMRDKARRLAREVVAGVPAIRRQEELEAGEFLEWLADNHVPFLGYRENRLERGRSADRLVPVPRSGLGLLRSGAGRPTPRRTELTGELRRKAREAAL
ncbi:MAG: NAD-glutamate dehydrogenase, partial [Steroidobacteraceae bacterium]